MVTNLGTENTIACKTTVGEDRLRLSVCVYRGKLLAHPSKDDTKLLRSWLITTGGNPKVHSREKLKSGKTGKM